MQNVDQGFGMRPRQGVRGSDARERARGIRQGAPTSEKSAPPAGRRSNALSTINERDLRFGARGPSQAMQAAARGLLGPIMIFSAAINLLMLAGPLFMLQVYERVLPAHSVPTLLVLFALLAFAYAVMIVLDHARARLAARVGGRFLVSLERPVFEASLHLHRRRPEDPLARLATANLDILHRWLGSPVFLALFDAPWVPVFLVVLWLFHPWLGILALVGTAGLLLLAVINQLWVRRASAQAVEWAQAADRLSGDFRSEADSLAALGMLGSAYQRWADLRTQMFYGALAAYDWAGLFAALSRGLRLFLQSAILALGALLVIRGELAVGAMFVSAIVLGRALAPVEQAVGQWGSIQAVRQAWQRLSALLASEQPKSMRLSLPPSEARLEVRELVVAPPASSRASLRGVSFDLFPGQVLGVMGPSGAGKSSLVHALVGAWPPVAGVVRLDGLALDAWDPEVLGCAIGYLPQRVRLFPGTVAENIARLKLHPKPEAVFEAARAAGADALIRTLPAGYDTMLGGDGAGLSGGQLQRLGLARALYGAPLLLVLDEPDSHLDEAGIRTLLDAIRAAKERGAAVVVVAHRPAVLELCDALLVLEHGRPVAFGPPATLLRRHGGHAPASAGSGQVGGLQPLSPLEPGTGAEGLTAASFPRTSAASKSTITEAATAGGAVATFWPNGGLPHDQGLSPEAQKASRRAPKPEATPPTPWPTCETAPTSAQGRLGVEERTGAGGPLGAQDGGVGAVPLPAQRDRGLG